MSRWYESSHYTQEPLSVYTQNNPYGYKVNINHPSVNPIYQRYKQHIGVPMHYPLSDNQRADFERYILPRLINRYK